MECGVDLDLFRGLFENRLSLLSIGTFLLATGLVSLLIPDSFMPAEVNVLVLGGCDLQIMQEEIQSYRSVSAGCSGTFENEAYISDSIDGRTWFRGTPVVTETFMFKTHNLTLHIWSGSGADYDSPLDPMEIETYFYPVFRRVVLQKNGWERDVTNTTDWGGVNFIDFEHQQEVEPPYNLTCLGTFNYDIVTRLSNIHNTRTYMPFFRVSVLDECTLTITYNATRPIEKIQVMNRMLAAFRKPSILLGISLSVILTVIGILILIIYIMSR